MLNSASPILVYGTGGMGREAAQCVRDLAASPPARYELAGFIDDRAGEAQTVHGRPVLTLAQAAERYPGAGVTIAVGDPATRERLTERVLAARLRPATVIHPRAEIGECVTIGAGSYVAPGTILTCDLALGAGVQVNVGSVIHHDVEVEDFVTLSPRVTLCGAVHVGRGAFLGAGAVVKQGVRIGGGAVVGMGAVVTNDVPPGEVWVGIPAKRLR